MELEVTWGRVFHIWWAYLWRNLIAIVAAMIAGAVVGGILGFILGAAGIGTETITMVTAPIGFVLGLLISIIPIKLILGKDFGEFRLVLIAKRQGRSQQRASVDDLDSAALRQGRA